MYEPESIGRSLAGYMATWYPILVAAAAKYIIHPPMSFRQGDSEHF